MKDWTFLDDPEQAMAYYEGHKAEVEKLNPLLVKFSESLTLAQFNTIFVYRYDEEAKTKGWVATEFQNTLGALWDNNQKSRTLAPREHLKTHTALSYVMKRIYERKYPIEVNYYHISSELAQEKFRKFQRVVERNPLLRANFDVDNAKSWSADRIELSDGSIITPLSYQQGVVGKHPHIIILDDVIDSKVIYSEERNSKATDKFYTDIYPQISKDDKTKKIIIIGTAQRKDDLYNNLPNDFKLSRFGAVISDATRQVLSPEIFTYEGLMKIKSDITTKKGDRFWQKEYMNVPFEASGLIIKAEWIKYAVLPNINVMPLLQKYQGWDLSVGKDIEKGDWTTCITIALDRRNLDKPDGKLRILILDVLRKRLNFGQRLQAIQDQYLLYKPLVVGVEDVAFQYDTIQQTRDKFGLPIIGVKAITNKVQSYQVELSPYFENGQVEIVVGGDWVEGFVNELISLPIGEYDDQADGLKIAVKTALLGGGADLPDQDLGVDETSRDYAPIFAGIRDT